MENRYQMYKNQGYKQYLLINAAQSGPPTSTYCAQVRDQYGLTFPVLYDPTGAFTNAYGFAGANEQNLVIKAGGEIVLNKRYASQSEVQQAIEGALP